MKEYKGYIEVIVLAIIAIAVSYLFTRFVVILGCKLFEIEFKELMALFVWLVMILIRSLRKE